MATRDRILIATTMNGGPSYPWGPKPAEPLPGRPNRAIAFLRGNARSLRSVTRSVVLRRPQGGSP